jgi:Tfp pilus assembly protein PilN
MTEVMFDVDTAAVAAPAVFGMFQMPRVNLLPPEIERARRLRRTQGVLAGGLLGVVALLGAGYGYEVHARHGAEQQLADVQAQTSVLQREQARYADVPRTVAAIDAAAAARESAMSGDVEWSRTLTDFSLTLPQNVWFSNVTLSVANPSAAAVGAAAGSGTAATPGAAATSGTAATSGVAATTAGTIGTVTVQGTARSHRDVASWLDTLAKQQGMSNPYFSSSQKDKIGTKTVVKFSSTATLTADALSNRYDRRQG